MFAGARCFPRFWGWQRFLMTAAVLNYWKSQSTTSATEVAINLVERYSNPVRTDFVLQCPSRGGNVNIFSLRQMEKPQVVWSSRKKVFASIKYSGQSVIETQHLPHQTKMDFNNAGVLLSMTTSQKINKQLFTNSVQWQWEIAWRLSHCADMNSEDLIYEWVSETTTSYSSSKSILEPNHLNICMSSALLLTNHCKLNFSAQLTHCQSGFDSIVTICGCQSS